MFDMRIKWLTIACFEMQFGQTTVVTDPCITAHEVNELTWRDIEHCDIIALSHAHWDHVTDLPALMERYPNAPLLTGPLSAGPLLDWLDIKPQRIYPMESGLELDFGEVKIRALFGRHRDLNAKWHEIADWGRRYPWFADDPDSGAALMKVGTLEYRNYLFTAKTGTKILLWGSTPSAEQKAMVKGLNADIAILQCTPSDAQEAQGVAEIAALSGAKVLIPHHMDFKKTPEQYLARVELLRQEYLKVCPQGRFLCPENGVWIDL